MSNEEKLSLDAHVGLLASYKTCQESIDFWEKELRKIKAQLADIMGSATIGTINDEEVLFYEPQERFRGKDFAKQYPDMYRSFVREMTVKRFDLDWFRDSRPDLYEQFRVRAMRNTFEMPSDKEPTWKPSG